MFTEFDLKFSQIATFKNYLTWGLYAKIQPVKEHDYFEARARLDQVLKDLNIMEHVLFLVVITERNLL